jgi:hypothetical protein
MSVIGSIGWSKRATASGPDQDFEYLPPLRRHLEPAGGVALDQPAHRHHCRGGAGDAGLGPFGQWGIGNPFTAMLDASSIGR